MKCCDNKKAIDELHYVPSLAAQSIRGSSAKTIGVLSFGNNQAFNRAFGFDAVGF